MENYPKTSTTLKKSKIVKDEESLQNELSFLKNRLSNINITEAKKIYTYLIDQITEFELGNAPISEKNKLLRTIISRIELTKETQYSKPHVRIEYLNLI